MSRLIGRALAVIAIAVLASDSALAQKKPAFPPVDKVVKDFTEVKSSDGKPTLYRLWVNKKTNQMYAGLPKAYASQKHFIALTVAGGQPFAGLQGNDFYVYWKKIGNRMALIKKNTQITSNGDKESKRSVARLFTDQVLLDVPIVTMDPKSGPVIDLDSLVVGQASKFFGPAGMVNSRLAMVKNAKSFPKNMEIAIEAPSRTGSLITLHYSFSNVPRKGSNGYKPRNADERVGYFTTSYNDYGKYNGLETKVRFINRWNLQKSNPELRLSPPKKPIVFYIENTTPVRYRKWIRKGVNYWNEAFEKVGIDQAIIIHDQDSDERYQNYDPEDVRYNFIRWLNNDISTAIGPSRVHPETGEILDADIVLTDGWIRVFQRQFQKEMPRIAMEGMDQNTLAWLAQNPNWDPRVRLAETSQRPFVINKIQQEAKMMREKGAMSLQTRMLGDEPFDGLLGRTSQVNGFCAAADSKSMDIAFMKLIQAVQEAKAQDEKKKDDKKKDKEPKEQMLDGIPESFIGPLLADLVCHEVGHTLGLRHNFKASSVYTLDQINSKELKGKKTYASSVMDYNPTNFRLKSGTVQGDWGMIGIGPYDFWAIEYGYGPSKNLPKVLAKNTLPEHQYATDEDTLGPDPLARRYDFSKDPLDFANEQMELVRFYRGKVLEKFVKKGESWSQASKGYMLTLNMQLKATSMMANWIGGVSLNRNRKGDPKGIAPLLPVAAKQQRAALKFVIDNTFFDDSFGMSPELLNHMTRDRWLDGESFGVTDPTFPLHDRVMGIQASSLTQIFNPSVLRRVYDNQNRVKEDEECLTLPEMLNTVRAAVWKELGKEVEGKTTNRKPAISSLRRNLQSEHINRLMSLANGSNGFTAAMRPLANLSKMQLKSIKDDIAKYLGANEKNLDDYTKAHLSDLQDRVERFLKAQYVAN